jgi:ribonuclease HI
MFYGVVRPLKTCGVVGLLFFKNVPPFFPDFPELISYLLSKMNADLMSLSVLIFHRIWLRRNRLIFEGQFSSPLKVFSEASSLFDDFKRFNSKDSMGLVSCPVRPDHGKLWKPPSIGSLKINWDASLNVNSDLVGMGCVIRKGEGIVLAAKCCYCKAVVDPVCAEAMAALAALDFCCDLGMDSIECEGDSLQIIKAVSSSGHSLDIIGHFLDALKLKAASLSTCKWNHCLREANEVAHLLARRASLRCFSHVWVEAMPLFIASASFRDFKGL